MTKVDIIKYKCDKCGAQYNTEEEACNCERVHVDVAKIEKLFYGLNAKYPHMVELKMSDGQIIRCRY